MRGMPIVMLVVSLGLVIAMFNAIGVFDIVSGPDTHIEEEVAGAAEENVSQIDPDEAGEGGFLSFTVSAIREVIGIMQLVVFLPSTLQAFGVPAAFAVPIGHGAQIVTAVMLANAWMGDGFR